MNQGQLATIVNHKLIALRGLSKTILEFKDQKKRGNDRTAACMQL